MTWGVRIFIWNLAWCWRIFETFCLECSFERLLHIFHIPECGVWFATNFNFPPKVFGSIKNKTLLRRRYRCFCFQEPGSNCNQSPPFFCPQPKECPNTKFVVVNTLHRKKISKHTNWMSGLHNSKAFTSRMPCLSSILMHWIAKTTFHVLDPGLGSAEKSFHIDSLHFWPSKWWDTFFLLCRTKMAIFAGLNSHIFGTTVPNVVRVSSMSSTINTRFPEEKKAQHHCATA